MGRLHDKKPKLKGKNKDKGGGNLGRGLQKSLNKNRRPVKPMSDRHTVDLNDGQDYGTVKKSITECSDVQDFLTRAQSAGISFAAEKNNVKFVQKKEREGILSDEEKAEFEKMRKENKNSLRVPRRPQWDTSMTKEDLNKSEHRAFENWRKQLCLLGSMDGIQMTPYERNIEFWRQLWRTVERSDVVVQIVDARDPLVFYCEDLKNYVKEVGFTKMSLLLVNKADFLTEDQRKAWVKYFTSIQVDVVFYSAAEENESEKAQSIESDLENLTMEESEKGDITVLEDSEENENYPETTDITETPYLNSSKPYESSTPKPLHLDEYLNLPTLLTRDQLTELFENVHTGPKYNEKYTTIGLVGYPNVGKSSTINSLLQAKKVSVSATPGKTKHFQTLHLTDDLVLCDCPGLVFPGFVSTKAEMHLSGILSVDEMTDYVPPVNQLLDIIPRAVLETTYGIDLPVPGAKEDPNRPPSAEDFLSTYGHNRGFMAQKGTVDKPRTARIVLKDFVKGEIVYCRAPPGVNQKEYHTVKPIKERKLNQKPVKVKTKYQEIQEKQNRIDEKMTMKQFRPTCATSHIKGRNVMEKSVDDMGRQVLYSDDGKVIKAWRMKPRKDNGKLRRKFGYLDA